MKKKDYLLFAGCFLIFFNGCQEALPPDMPKLYPFQITIVDENNVPLDQASVTAISTQTSNKWNASGITNAAGKVNLMTLGKYKGIAHGAYKVTVSKNSKEATGKLNSEGNEIFYLLNYIDKSYANEVTTPLEISAEKKSDQIELKIKRLDPPQKVVHNAD